MPFFEYFALEPLQNRDLLDSGAGAAPLNNASTAYKAMDNALEIAAANTDGLLRSLSNAWPLGTSSERAQAAFDKHNQWVREQARNASKIARLADRGAQLHNNALGTMPSRFEIEAAMAQLAASAALMASSGTVASAGAGPASAAALLVFGAATAWHAMAEIEYNRLKIQAATTMMSYEIGALGLLGDLVGVAGTLTPPPPIVVPGPGAVPTQGLDPVGPLQNLITKGPDSPYYPGNEKPTTTTTDTNTQQHTGNGTESSGDSNPGGSDSGTGGEGTDPGPSGPEQQSLTDPQQPIGSESGFDSGTNGYGTESSSYSNPLPGVSSESSTLVALGSGGAVAGFGMARGGIGSMPGAATGFRLPGNWNPASGTAFGASNPSTATAAPARGAARRVSAPTARMRRRRKDEETRTGKVFTPGEQFEVPELERPPVIGVIEYEDDEPDTELLADSSLVGVLDRLDEETEPENGYGTR
ncbi:PPE domain-containing protein [Nocardia sienata]|uniref:PPE domain-containing protein n=1 Tax=Nocardia sienata TaxID=248552 RepID=UPI0007A3AA45|nr:PPE domain-containing protein [Nocardia sienata]